MRALVAIGKQGKWVLPTGLLAALLFPSIATRMQVAIGPLLVVLLVISFLQINGHANEAWSDQLLRSVALIVCIQLIVPIVLLLLMRFMLVPLEWQIPVTLVAAASCITGGPSIVMMLGGNGMFSIRHLVVSTLLLPITALPVLALLPLYSSTSMLFRTSIMLTLVVFGAYVVAKLIRTYVLRAYDLQQRQCLDGLSAIFLALIVLGLMAAIHTAWSTPAFLLTTLFWACVVNVVLQVLGVVFNHLFSMDVPIVLGVMTGNRAVAIFLTALPASSYQPFLLFIACYQIPMYLTPLLGSYFYKRFTDNAT